MNKLIWSVTLLTVVASIGCARNESSTHIDPVVQQSTVNQQETLFPAVTIEGLEKFSGQKISVFYVNAEANMTGPARLIKTIAPITSIIQQNGFLEIETHRFVRSREAPNYLVIAIHENNQESVFLRDYFGELIGDPRCNVGDCSVNDSGETESKNLRILSISNIENNPHIVWATTKAKR